MRDRNKERDRDRNKDRDREAERQREEERQRQRERQRERETETKRAHGLGGLMYCIATRPSMEPKAKPVGRFDLSLKILTHRCWYFNGLSSV